MLDDHAKGRAKAYEDEASTDEDGKVKVVQVIFHVPIINYGRPNINSEHERNRQISEKLAVLSRVVSRVYNCSARPRQNFVKH